MRVAAVSGDSSWTGRERQTLSAIAETIIEGAGERPAQLVADAFATSLDPGQVRQLRLALRLFDSRLANLLLVRRARRFVDMEPAARERYLLAWAGSRLALRRAAFQAFKRALAFVAGADPGVDPDATGGSNPLWAHAGYAPTFEPVTSEPTPIRPFELSPGVGAASEPGTQPSASSPAALRPRASGLQRTDPADRAIELDADVVVVGSGAGGGVIAAELSRAGRSVVVLEAGPFVPEPEMPTNELDAFDRMYLDHGLVSSWDGSVAILAGGSLGGGTTVNWMTCIRPPDGVRHAWATQHGLSGVDGPEADDDLAVIERELGVSAPPNVPPKDAAILRGAAALGFAAGETRRDGVGCGDCGSCPFGCRSGAKQSGLRAHLADAWRCGARIVPDATVRRVIMDSGRATGVEVMVRVRDAGGGAGGSDVPGEATPSWRRLRVHARQVVVAAGALRTPVILEASGVKHPALGRYLRLHPVAILGAFFADPVLMWRGTMQAAASLEFLADGRPGAFVVESAPGHLGLAMLAFPWESRSAYHALVGRLGNVAPLIGIVADSGGGRVRSTRNGNVRIDYRVDRRDAVTLRRALVEMARIGRAAGAEELVALGTPPAWWRGTDAPGHGGDGFGAYLGRLSRFDFAPHRGMVFSAHQMGSARMGASWAEHPVDPAGRVRTGRPPTAGVRGSRSPVARQDRIIRGLYVGDSSLFPTAIAVNPMITVMALARRVARTIVAE